MTKIFFEILNILRGINSPLSGIRRQVCLNNHTIQLTHVRPNLGDFFKDQFFNKTALHFKNYKQSPFETCSICLEDIKVKSLVTMLSCNHGFHTNCIRQWLVQSDVCPLCKASFLRKHQHHIKFIKDEKRRSSRLKKKGKKPKTKTDSKPKETRTRKVKRIRRRHLSQKNQ